MPEDPHPQAIALYNRGCVLQARQEFEAAISCYTEALAIDPRLASAYSNRGAALAAMNRCEEALASLDRAIDLEPDYPEAHFSRAVTLLLEGELPAGWLEFEWRWKTVPGRILRQSKNFPQPPWLGGEAVAGRTLLLYCERGLGDTLQFCRYAKLVSELQAKVILQVQAPLVELMRSLGGEIRVISETEALPHFDLQCPLLSLPLVFGTSLQNVPALEKYIRADAGKVSQLRNRLDQLARLGATRGLVTPATVSSAVLLSPGAAAPRVGLVWRGDAHNPDDRNRSIALRELLTFLPAELRYFSLQKEITAEERALLEADTRVTVLSSDLGFEDTAALCECLDLVIAIDTSVAHLAAALGRRTWILLPFNPDCRWLLKREDSPWYPSVKLYRQARSGDWLAVLARVRDALNGLPRRA
jgi:tetratricopeptide (TPR) repeat protein